MFSLTNCARDEISFDSNGVKSRKVIVVRIVYGRKAIYSLRHPECVISLIRSSSTFDLFSLIIDNSRLLPEKIRNWIVENRSCHIHGSIFHFISCVILRCESCSNFNESSVLIINIGILRKIIKTIQ